MLHHEKKGEGENIILLHGWGFHSGIFTEIAAELAKDFCVTVVDLPGFGQSPINEGNYDLVTLAKLILEIAPMHAMYVGWSIGGLVATYIAQHHPTRVTKLINLASSPKFIASNDWPGMSLENVDTFSTELSDDFINTVKKFVGSQLFHSELTAKKLQELEQRLFQYGIPHRKALRGGLEILRHTDLRNNLANITCSKQYILGQLDRIVPVMISKKINILDPTITVNIIPKANHIPFLSNLSETVLFIKNFMYAK